MSHNGWTHFESGGKRDSVRFALMGNPPRFLRIRDRSRDCQDRGRAYIVIDLWARKVLKDQTEFVPRAVREKGS